MATLSIGTEVLKKRGYLDPSAALSELTIFIRGDGVVDWTGRLDQVADAKKPRNPNNCLNFALGDIDEGSPLHWSIVSAAVLPRLDLMRLH
eukprot:gene1177-2678_t